MDVETVVHAQPKLLVPAYLPLYHSQNVPFPLLFLSPSAPSDVLSASSFFASSNPTCVQVSFFNAHVVFHRGSHSSIGNPSRTLSAFRHAEYCKPGPGFQSVNSASPVTISPSGCSIFVFETAAEMTWGQTPRQLTF